MAKIEDLPGQIWAVFSDGEWPIHLRWREHDAIGIHQAIVGEHRLDDPEGRRVHIYVMDVSNAREVKVMPEQRVEARIVEKEPTT